MLFSVVRYVRTNGNVMLLLYLFQTVSCVNSSFRSFVFRYLLIFLLCGSMVANDTQRRGPKRSVDDVIESEDDSVTAATPSFECMVEKAAQLLSA